MATFTFSFKQSDDEFTQTVEIDDLPVAILTGEELRSLVQKRFLDKKNPYSSTLGHHLESVFFNLSTKINNKYATTKFG